MSSFSTTYIGPALLAKFSMIEVLAPYYGCGNSNCTSFQSPRDHGYCPVCGQACSLLTHRTTTQESPGENQIFSKLQLAGLTLDTLTRIENRYVDNTPESTHIWIPNAYRNPPRIFVSYRKFFVDVRQINIEDELKWFQEAYGPELAVIIAEYQSSTYSWVVIND